MDFYGNIDLLYNKMNNMVFQQESNFPQVPKVGRVVFKDQKLYMCVALNVGVPVWIPLTNKINTYIHTQGSASSSWTISHNLNITTPIVQVYDSMGEMVIPNNVSPISNNEMSVDLTTAITGTAIVLYGNLMPNLGVGILEPYDESANLIGFYPFNETSGTTATESVSSIDGTLVGNILINQPSNFGVGYLFDGSGDYITSGDNFGFDKDDAFSFSFWVKPISNNTIIFSKEENLGNFTGYGLTLTSSNELRFGLVNSSSSKIVIQSIETVSLNVWSMITISYDGSSDVGGVNMYIDNTPVTSTIDSNTLTSSILTGVSFNIGARENSITSNYHGEMDQFRIYNAALTDSDVVDLYNITKRL